MGIWALGYFRLHVQYAPRFRLSVTGITAPPFSHGYAGNNRPRPILRRKWESEWVTWSGGATEGGREEGSAVVSGAKAIVIAITETIEGPHICYSLWWDSAMPFCSANAICYAVRPSNAHMVSNYAIIAVSTSQWLLPRPHCCFVAQYGTRKPSLLSTEACLTDWAALIGALTQLDVLVEPMFLSFPSLSTVIVVSIFSVHSSTNPQCSSSLERFDLGTWTDPSPCLSHWLPRVVLLSQGGAWWRCMYSLC